MKPIFTLTPLFMAGLAFAQEPIIDEWVINNTVIATYQDGASTISTGSLADCQQICFTSDSVYVASTGLAADMGDFLNPGSPADQGYVWRFPRNAQEETVTKSTVPNIFAAGVLVNGVPIFGKGDDTSYDAGTGANQPNMMGGDGVWNQDAWYSEGWTLDAAYGGHPTPMGQYHSHATPYNLYPYPSSSHSPIVGFAFDGFPIYGPFGYSDPMDSGSTIQELQSSYQLRSISVRTTLPDGSPAPAIGPNVSSGFPLGMYIEDYEYVTGSGDLDEYNGRFCVTPEYPAGTFAYFLTTDGSNNPAFPYYLATEYYGITDEVNTSPMTALSTMPTPCNTTGVAELETVEFDLYPNPAEYEFTVQLANNEPATVSIINTLGQTVMTEQLTQSTINISGLDNGIYIVRVDTEKRTGVQQLIIQH